MSSTSLHRFPLLIDELEMMRRGGTADGFESAVVFANIWQSTADPQTVQQWHPFGLREFDSIPQKIDPQ